MRKTKLGSHHKDQTSLVPAWKSGDEVEIIGTGLFGLVFSPVGAGLDVWWVKLMKVKDPEKDRLNVLAVKELVKVHATGLRLAAL